MLFLKHVWLRFADSMNKVSKLNMFYHLEDAQGIRAAVNTGTSASALTPLAVTTFSMTSSPTLAVGVSSPMLEVDHLVGTATNLSVEEPTSPLASTKRVRNEGQ